VALVRSSDELALPAWRFNDAVREIDRCCCCCCVGRLRPRSSDAHRRSIDVVSACVDGGSRVAGRRLPRSSVSASDVEPSDRELSSRRSGAISDDRNDRGGTDCDRDGDGTTLTATDDHVDGRRGGSGGGASTHWSSAASRQRDDLKPAHSECRHEHRAELSPPPPPPAAVVSSVAGARPVLRFSCLTVVRPRLCC